MQNIKGHLASMAQTFLAMFVLSLAVEITQLPKEMILDYTTWTNAMWAGILVTAARQSVKLVWQMFVPSQPVLPSQPNENSLG